MAHRTAYLTVIERGYMRVLLTACQKACLMAHRTVHLMEIEKVYQKEAVWMGCLMV